ncbi:MAG: SpoIIE family protein phosphatase [Spirochaetota bacterium]
MDIHKRCILLVDDEQNITNALTRELEDWADERSLEIFTAISAAKGLEILEKRGGDTVIVVSDLKMPEMKGSDFLLEVKRLYPDIVSILLTGYSETEEIIKSVQAGIFSFMLKPWDSNYLIGEVQKAWDFGEARRHNASYLHILEEEMKWAGEFQKSILKPNLPGSAGVEFRVSYRPVPGLYCGGDYYDVIPVGQDRYLLLIGDVEGHGVKAAFITGILKAVIYSEYVQAFIGKVLSTAAFLSWLNQRLNFEFRKASSLMVTFFAAILDLKAGTLRYSNAGHNHPYILREGKAIEVPISGSAIGFANSISFAEQTVNLKPGDLVVIFTDGLVEIDCAKGRDPLKPGPILEKVEQGAEHHRRLLEAVLAESASSDFTDDVTILTAKVL